MLDIPISNNQVVTVMVAQTTFAVLTMPGQQYRVDYLEKEEAYLKPGMRGRFASYSEHPLLLNYNSRLVEVYINSRPQNSQQLFIELRERIQNVFQHWRDWRCVLLDKGEAGENQLRKNLLDGSGLLLRAPAIVAKAVMDACAEHGVLTYVLGDIENPPQVIPPFNLLLIGEGYVIAQDFSFVKL